MTPESSFIYIYICMFHTAHAPSRYVFFPTLLPLGQVLTYIQNRRVYGQSSLFAQPIVLTMRETYEERPVAELQLTVMRQSSTRVLQQRSEGFQCVARCDASAPLEVGVRVRPDLSEAWGNAGLVESSEYSESSFSMLSGNEEASLTCEICSFHSAIVFSEGGRHNLYV